MRLGHNSIVATVYMRSDPEGAKYNKRMNGRSLEMHAIIEMRSSKLLPEAPTRLLALVIDISVPKALKRQ